MRYVEDLYEYEKLKWHLLKKYASCTIEEELKGCTKKNKKGTYCQIKNQTFINLSEELNKAPPLSNELKLIRGIGERREKKLKDRGIKTITDLIEKDIFSSDAEKIQNNIKNNNSRVIYNRIKKLPDTTIKNYLSLINMMGEDKILFLDIESLGLNDEQIFLIGTGHFLKEKKDIFLIEQFLARSDKEEEALLTQFKAVINNYEGVISFNGKRFDENMLKKRCEKFGISDLNFPEAHIDLLYLVRRKWGENLKNCKLSTVERSILDIERKNDPPGALIPHFYDFYKKNKNIGPLIPIIQHNANDLTVLPQLIRTLYKKDL